MCSGPGAAGPAAASGSNRAAFVSRGCWSPCDQSCATPSLDRGPGVTRGRDGTGGGEVRGTGWEAVEVAEPPSHPHPTTHPPLLPARQQAWMIDYPFCALIGPLWCRCCDTREDHMKGTEGSVWRRAPVFIVATFFSSFCCSSRAGMKPQKKRSSDDHLPSNSLNLLTSLNKTSF